MCRDDVIAFKKWKKQQKIIYARNHINDDLYKVVVGVNKKSA